jgi:short-subunit dehydrogenase
MTSIQTASWRDRYGPWAVVTGASEGIGREIALELAARGLSLVLVARRRELLEQLTHDLPGRVSTRVVATDLATLAGVEAVTAATEELDVGLLVAAAGFGTSGAFLAADRERELRLLDVNCRAPLLLAHHFGRRLAARGRGGMVLLSSILAFQGVPQTAHYAATKAYVQSLAEGIGRELATLGVDVLASAPGPVASGFAAVANMRYGAAVPAPVVARETLDALGRRRTVRPGWLSKILTAGLSILPRPARVLLMERVMAGMTGHQRPAA